MYSRILVPVDGSETSTLGLQEAIKVADAFKSQVRLMHVVNEFIMAYSLSEGGTYTDLIDSMRNEGRLILADAAEFAQRQGNKAEFVLLESLGGSAADSILSQAKSWPADLIVMGTHGRRGLAHLALGSDAERVLREAPVPILLVRGNPRPKHARVEAKLLETSDP